MFFSRFFRRETVEPPAPGSKPAGPASEASRAAASSAAAPAAPPAPEAGPATAPGEDTRLSEAEAFSAMQEILGEHEARVRVPGTALLRELPEAFRGPAYDPDRIPEDVVLELGRNDLMQQLRRGRVVYPLNELLSTVPDGWVNQDPDALVELHLPDLVAAIAPDELRGSTAFDDETIAIAQMRDYFRPAVEEEPPSAPRALPAAASAPAPVAPPPAVEPAASAATRPPAVPTAPKTPRPRPTPPPWAWDGVERGRDPGAAAVDINEARTEDLERLPGVGRARAERILAWRDRHGPFRGIFDLRDIPGVGRKLFLSMTGLPSAVTKRRDRHARLNALIGLAEDERPMLGMLVQQIARTLDLEGCVLADHEGVILAETGAANDRHALIAALVPKLFRRARRYLLRLVPEGADMIVLPSAHPPLALVRAGGYYLVALPKPGAEALRACEALGAIGTELDWLLGPRAVVREEGRGMPGNFVPAPESAPKD